MVAARTKLLVALVLSLSSPVLADVFEPTFQEVAPGVWVGIRHDSPQFPVMGTTTFVVSDEGVVVFDGGGVALMAERVLTKIRTVTTQPLTHIVISHWHGDHHLGIHRLLDAFPQAQVIAHSFTRAAMSGAPMDYVLNFPTSVPRLEARFQALLDSGVTGTGEPLAQGSRVNLQRFLDDADLVHAEYNRVRVTSPTITFHDSLAIHSGDRVVELRHLGHGNTEGDIVMWLPQERIVATGDLVVSPIPYAFNVPPKKWVQTLRALKALDFAILVPGHGDIQTDAAYLDLLIEAVQSIVDQRDDLLAQGMSPEETEAALDFSQFKTRFTGGDGFLDNRFQAWFSKPFRKAALKALTDAPMVKLEREPAPEAN